MSEQGSTSPRQLHSSLVEPSSERDWGSSSLHRPGLKRVGALAAMLGRHRHKPIAGGEPSSLA